MKTTSLTRLFLFTVFLSFFSCSNDEEGPEPVTITMTFEDFSITIPENFDTQNQKMVKIADYLDVKSSDEKEVKVTYALLSQSVENALRVSGEYLVFNEDFELDFETHPSLTAEIQARAGEVSKTATLTISLTDVYEPVWTIADFEITINENPEDEDELGRIEIVGFNPEKDPSNFTVQLLEESHAGAMVVFANKIFLAVKDASFFDYETNPTITAKIQISDENGYTQTGNITIHLNDVDEADWTLNDFEVTIDENPSDSQLGNLSLQGYNPVHDGMITYALSNVSPTAALKLVNASGVTYVNVNNASLFDYETNPTITATVTATDANGFSNSASITIHLNDVTEMTWSVSDIDIYVDENQSQFNVLTYVGIQGYNPSEHGNMADITYEAFNQQPAGAITFNPSMGSALLVSNPSLFDYEQRQIIRAQVQVTLGNGQSQTINVKIRLNDIDGM
ncbi:cadherin repeat domain-containing protein [Rapidithrix thailandica]|uniref:Cadherin repeat domain-containing protein n=1 Tax=Rapidithrix thailandica TaxID=413964 RepID=A0AAW9RV73_9BACT